MEDNVNNNIVVDNNNNSGDKKVRKTLIIALVGFIVLGALIFVASKAISGGGNKEHLKYNTNKKFLADKKVEDLSFENIKCSYDGSDSILSYIIVNNSDKTVHLDEYEIVIKDDKDKVLATINPNYDYDLEAKAKFETSNSVSVDLTKASKLDITLHSAKDKEETPEVKEGE